jgi:hypothetical protein
MCVDKTALLDRLVGTAEQRDREAQAERLGGLEIEDQFYFCKLLHRQFGGRLAFENAPSISAGQIPQFGEIASIADQPAGRGELPIWVNCRQSMARCQRSELIGQAIEEWISDDNKRLDPPLHEDQRWDAASACIPL